ncbi:MAG: V-type ATP synthase subunit A [Defluviitaleaceae bacterium]|nr:V-type ATP synthase subunit A [Defluviitaleaceae bacterium]
MSGTISGVNGSVITVKDYRSFVMGEMVNVGTENLIGEVIRIDIDKTLIQVFENTAGLKCGETIKPTGKPLAITLGPGIIGNIFDGILRPLKAIEDQSGIFISRGINTSSIDMDKKWFVKIMAVKGFYITEGAVIGEVSENETIIHKIMLPVGISGKIISVKDSGEYSAKDILAVIEDSSGTRHEITLAQRWSIRVPRPILARKSIHKPLITGQRVLDTMFPIAKGGAAAVPGGFGTGKTMTQHQLAKWSDADIIVYIGCGERGNEMTGALEEFSALIDPRSGRPLMERTVLIANTSNMPVAAREASIYTGITIAEYYRDMGYDVALMADSTSRWAEALRELSGRLEELPAEEGFPAYLTSRLASFYERAGCVRNLNETEGSVTIIGAVSPQGGDFSEPVTGNTKRFVKAFWALDKNLAYGRHFPAINWLTSYSEYLDDLALWYAEYVSKDFLENREQLMKILNQEAELMEIVKLIGADVLPDNQKLILEIGKLIRIGFAQQNAYHLLDTYTNFEKQFKMVETILYLYKKSKSLVDKNIPISIILQEHIFVEILSVKYNISNEEAYKIDEFKVQIDEFYIKILKEAA